MRRKAITTIKSQDEARNIAIEWQSWLSTKNLSYSELADWQSYFKTLAKKFNLIKEFKENCII